MIPAIFINYANSNSDKFFQSDLWLYRVRVNDYQVITIAWNIMLIAVPFLLAFLLIRWWGLNRFARIYDKLGALLLFAFWLIFIPNTVYVISEVRHLVNYCPEINIFKVCEQSAWMILFFFTYGLIGWVSFYYLLEQMKQLVAAIWGARAGWVFLVLMIPASALGMLLGLLHRWNSWELFLYPKLLLATIWPYFTTGNGAANWFIFTVFLLIFYASGRLILRPVDFIKAPNANH